MSEVTLVGWIFLICFVGGFGGLFLIFIYMLARWFMRFSGFNKKRNKFNTSPQKEHSKTKT